MSRLAISRRRFLQTSGLSIAGLAMAKTTLDATADTFLPLITKPVPASGEQLPVIGVGTNQFGTDDPEILDRLRIVLQRLPEMGGSVIDTARSYGSSEVVIGELMEEVGNRDAVFLATKTPTRGSVSDEDIEDAFQRLRIDRIDLLQVHNFNQTNALLPRFIQLKAEGRVRYIGCSTSRDSQYQDMKSVIGSYPLDFIQVDYSIENRTAADQILPMAADKGIAVLANMPFGGRRNAATTFSRVADLALPDWAADVDIGSWAQFFLKYVVSHPAVTVAIPGTTRPHHLTDNLGAARGRLPDATLRGEMERLWDALP